MEFNKYTIFLEVAKQQNLSKAAQALGYTQSGISHTLKRMEKDMGLTLFDRNKKGAFLTNEGRELLPYITQLVQCQESLDQVIHSMHDLHQGSLTIGTYSSISRRWLPHIIQKYKIDFPSIHIDFKEGGNRDILQWLTDGEADMGFLSNCPRKGFDWIPLATDPLMAVLPADYSFPDPVSYGDIKAFPLSEFNKKTFIISAPGIDVDIHETLKKHSIRPDIQYSAKDDFTIISMVACHLGISILPKLVLENYDAPVITLPLDPFAKRDLGIALPKKSTASPAALKFIEYTKEIML